MVACFRIQATPFQTIDEDVCPYAATIQCLGICEFSGNPLACKEFYDEAFNKPLPQPEGAYGAELSEVPIQQEENAQEFEEQQPLSSHLPASHLPASASENERFYFETDEKMAELAEGIVPQCTASSTKWALSNFTQWKNESILLGS